jgi:hypothetical protein
MIVWLKVKSFKLKLVGAGEIFMYWCCPGKFDSDRFLDLSLCMYIWIDLVVMVLYVLCNYTSRYLSQKQRTIGGELIVSLFFCNSVSVLLGLSESWTFRQVYYVHYYKRWFKVGFVCDLLISSLLLQMCLEDKTWQDIIHVKLTGQVTIHLERMKQSEHLMIVTCAMGYNSFSYLPSNSPPNAELLTLYLCDFFIDGLRRCQWH